jgi:hypothetical protein
MRASICTAAVCNKSYVMTTASPATAICLMLKNQPSPLSPLNTKSVLPIAIAQ